MKTGEDLDLLLIFKDYLEKTDIEQVIRLKPNAPEKAKKELEEWLKEEKDEIEEYGSLGLLEIYKIFEECLEKTDIEQVIRLKPNAPEKAKDAFKKWIKEEKRVIESGITIT